MQITLDELVGLTTHVQISMRSVAEKYEHEVSEHMLREIKADIEFRHWLKNHYPEAIAEWNALQKIGE